MQEIRIGTVLHFFPRPMVAAIEIDGGSLALGDPLHIKGHRTDLYLRIESMQVENKGVEAAHPGDKVGIKVTDRVRERDGVFKIEE